MKEKHYHYNAFLTSANERCRGRDSNPHELLARRILSPLRLPFRHPGFKINNLRNNKHPNLRVFCYTNCLKTIPEKCFACYCPQLPYGTEGLTKYSA